MPQGAFYAFPQLPDHAPASLEFCKQALDSEGLALVPGAAFGDDRCVRFFPVLSQVRQFKMAWIVFSVF